ncbi:UNVERIFIED_ORG: hypothetical protein J2S99_001401 [Atlantibacter hermannii]|nr:hypothetical protein [Atlantibacter hermannii]
MEKLIIKASCPNCAGLRNCTVHGELRTHWDDPEFQIYGSLQHHLLQCNGCETVFYQINENFSEHTTHKYINGEWADVPIDMVTTYPPVESSKIPIWISKLESVDGQLFHIFNEIYFSYSADNFTLASIGLRTIFDRTTEILQIHPGLRLNEKVEKLKSEGFIGDTESKVLSSVIDAGSAAAHRSWSPKKVEFEQLLEVIESFVQRTVLGKKSLAHITEKIPERVRRPKKIED